MAAVSVEYTFIIAAVRAALREQALLAADAGAIRDWRALIKTASAHGLLSVVSDAIAQLPDAVVPAVHRVDVAGQLRIAAGHLRVASEARTLLDALRMQGVKAVLAAAPDAVLALCGPTSTTLRRASLLVDPIDRDAARTTLLMAGCVEDVRASREPARIQFMGPGGARVALETAIAGTSCGAAFSIALALDRAVDAPLAGRTVRALEADDRLIALCARAVARRWPRLDYAVAIAALMGELGDRPGVLERARRARLRRAVLTGVALAHDLFGVETALTPAALRDRIARYSARAAQEMLTGSVPARSVRTLVDLAVRDGVVDRLRYVSEKARKTIDEQRRRRAARRPRPMAPATMPANRTAPRKLLLRQFQSPGDLVMLTAAVRDLHTLYPGRFITDVRTPCPDLWLNNPYITPLNDDDPAVETIQCEYPLIHRSNQTPVHFIYGFIDFLNDHLGLNIKPTAFKGDIHLSDVEKRQPSPIQSLAGVDVPYWIVSAGGKLDFTIKWWSHARYQDVVDRFRGRLLFVQVGEGGHHHPPLDGVIDLRGKTSLRDLIRLMHHAEGAIGPVSLGMHLAAAVEPRAGASRQRPCVVIAGGREPVQWEAYPGHQFLHTIGALPCCETGGCWRSRTLPIGDGDSKDEPSQLCVDVVDGLPRCMDAIAVDDVVRAIALHVNGGVVGTLTSEQHDAVRRLLTVPVPDEAPAAASRLPIWCQPSRPVERAGSPAASICVLTSGDRLPLLQRCLESIRQSCPRDIPLVVGATAISTAVREYLYSVRLAGTIDRLHESPIEIDKTAMMRRLLADVRTEYVWWFDDESQVATAEALSHCLASAALSPDLAMEAGAGPDGRPRFARTAVFRDAHGGATAARAADGDASHGRSQGGGPTMTLVAPAPWDEASGPSKHRSLCFTTCFNEGFLEGAKGTIRSIRKFYKPEEAAIVAFAESPTSRLEEFCLAMHVELHYFRDIEAWAIPLVYSKREYLDDAGHFYHADFRPHPALPHHTDRTTVGFTTLRHLNPLNVKAYCTGYCLNVKNFDYLVHIDADAFLLSRVDDLLDEMPRDSVVGFDDGTDDLPNLETLYHVRKPEGFHDGQYAFNAGVVFYRNGQAVQRLMLDFMHYAESCYHYTYSGSFADQGLLRALVAKHHISGEIRFELREATNWNPTWNRADNLRFCPEKAEWVNVSNGKKQYVWHGAGGEKLWSGKYQSDSVNAAWAYIGGEVHGNNWWDVKGSLIRENCAALCTLISDHYAMQKDIAILEIGTQYGRTSIAMCVLLGEAGKNVTVDTCDIFSPSPDYPVDFPRQEEALANIRSVRLESAIRSHKVAENEDLIRRFGGRHFDVVFIDGNHEFKQVLADCLVAKALLKTGGLIVGDDWQIGEVRDASTLVFAPQTPRTYGQHLWFVRL